MKKFLTASLVAILVIVLGGMVLANNYKDGEYIGYVANDKGDVVIAVGIVKGFITNVEIINPVKHVYSHDLGRITFLTYGQMVVDKQAGNIDTVVGATSSYKDYNAAVQMALDVASGTYTGNTYYGLVRDYGHGHTLVEVVLNDKKDKMESVRFITRNPAENLATRETLVADKSLGYPHAAGKAAFETFPGKVMAAQSVHVDAVAGATHSNVDFYKALAQALANAGALRTFEAR